MGVWTIVTTETIGRWRLGAWTLARETFAVCWRYRVTGLAAEAAFFALVSLPPLVLGLVGSIGFLASRLDPGVVDEVKSAVLNAASNFLTPDTVQDFVAPLLNDVLARGRADLTFIGVVVTLWAGSRCLNVYVDTISIMHGLGSRRGPVHIRVVSFSLYIAALITGILGLPLIAIGPGFLKHTFPAIDGLVDVFYWPLVALLALPFLATLYHVSVPQKNRWIRAFPGAALAFIIWVFGAFLLRVYLASLFSGSSVYGGFAAPVAVLFWAYLTAIAVLIGAAMNAVLDGRHTAAGKVPGPQENLMRRDEAPA
jgi:membrane protein